MPFEQYRRATQINEPGVREFSIFRLPLFRFEFKFKFEPRFKKFQIYSLPKTLREHPVKTFQVEQQRENKPGRLLSLIIRGYFLTTYYLSYLPPKYLTSSHIKSEMHDIAILNDIIFSLDSNFSGFTNFSFAFINHIIFIFDNLGSDKSFFKIRMDNTSCLRCRSSNGDGPSSHFLYASRKISLLI